jgi:DNA-binding response OmpR family regulator
MPEKILIVDDDIDTLRLVGMMLERQGYTIAAASNGQQAIALAKSEQPDLILLDVMMPDLDGYEVTKLLRSDDSTSHIPIIMFTAKSQVDDKLMGFELGVDDYLTKPTQPRELFAHVKAVLSRVTKTRELVMPRERGIAIGVMSVKGGLGVTTLTLNLGIALHQQTQKDVIAAEFRPGQGTISLELGYTKPEGMNRLLQRKQTEITPRLIEGELVSHGSGIRLFLSSPQPKDSQYVALPNHFEHFANHLHVLARYTVIDLGAGLTPMVEKVLPQCENLIVVVEPVPHIILQTKWLLEDLLNIGVGEGRVRVVLYNRVRSGMQLSWSQVQEKLGMNVVTVFTPAPELAYQATVHGVPMIIQQPNSLTAEQFAKLASKITERGR